MRGDPCDNCGDHAAIAVFDDNWGFTPPEDRKPVEYLCLHCAGRASIFVLPSTADKLRQEQADEGLRMWAHGIRCENCEAVAPEEPAEEGWIDWPDEGGPDAVMMWFCPKCQED